VFVHSSPQRAVATYHTYVTVREFENKDEVREAIKCDSTASWKRTYPSKSKNTTSETFQCQIHEDANGNPCGARVKMVQRGDAKWTLEASTAPHASLPTSRSFQRPGVPFHARSAIKEAAGRSNWHAPQKIANEYMDKNWKAGGERCVSPFLMLCAPRIRRCMTNTSSSTLL
jgi:hypothetical protein